jgi:hypothetical protein
MGHRPRRGVPGIGRRTLDQDGAGRRLRFDIALKSGNLGTIADDPYMYLATRADNRGLCDSEGQCDRHAAPQLADLGFSPEPWMSRWKLTPLAEPRTLGGELHTDGAVLSQGRVRIVKAFEVL